jgi:hypothetical protein
LIHPYAARVRVVKQRSAERGKDAPNGSENLSLFRFLKNSLSQAAQKDLRGEARERSTSEGVLTSVRWSEAIERNEAYEAFSAACEAIP